MVGPSYSGDASSAPTLGDTAPTRARESAGLNRGDAVGRYVILGVVGHGGMGVVYAAYDPELDRKLAIKLLHPSARDDADGSVGQQRMLREARAMAKLAHPNVVTVHDTGPFDRSVFVAMEFIAGQTLKSWLAGATRDWREIVAVFRAAGEGLAAAHDAGLVHRDFKPDNVMIADTGRVVVMDFGLALTTAEQTDSMRVAASVAGDDRLTVTGALMGTPAYMAPEQHMSATTSASTDQYSFCVSLYEALWRQRPFESSSVAALAVAITTTAPRLPMTTGGVPARIRRAVFRGLSSAPMERWPSMRELLAELTIDSTRARRRAAAVLVPLAIIGVGAAVYRSQAGPEPCAGGRERVATVWSAEARSTLANAFDASGHPNAADTGARVVSALDRFADDFEAEYRKACAATRIENVQTNELLDRRMSCLERRLDDVGAVIRELERVDEKVIDRAVGAVTRAGQLAACRDLDALARDAPEPTDPTDPAQRARLDALRRQVSTARAQSVAGRPEAAAATLDAILGELGERDGRIRADALFVRAQTHTALGDPAAGEAAMSEAHWTARKSGNDRVAAQTAAELMVIVGASRPELGAMWEQQARAEVDRLGDDGELRARLLDDLADVALRNHDLDEAERLHSLALPIWSRIGGPESLDVAVVEHGLGHVEFMRKNDAAAIAHYEHAIAIWHAELGENHPHLADAYIMLGHIAHRAGRIDDAEREYLRALEVRERIGGKDDVELLAALSGLGLVYTSRGDYAAALDNQRRGVAIAEAAWGQEHPNFAVATSNLGDVLALLGRHEEALEEHRRALAIRERVLPPDHPVVGATAKDVAKDLVALGRPAEAMPMLERARAIADARGDAQEVAELRAELQRLR